MLLFITHILGSITVGIIFRFWKKNLATRQQYTISKYDNKLQNITVSNLGEILGTSIQSAISTILMIMAWRGSKWLFAVLMPFYILLCCATVYIQAHYLIDAIVGFFSAFVMYVLVTKMFKKWFAVPMFK